MRSHHVRSNTRFNKKKISPCRDAIPCINIWAGNPFYELVSFHRPIVGNYLAFSQMAPILAERRFIWLHINFQSHEPVNLWMINKLLYTVRSPVHLQQSRTYRAQWHNAARRSIVQWTELVTNLLLSFNLAINHALKLRINKTYRSGRNYADNIWTV